MSYSNDIICALNKGLKNNRSLLTFYQIKIKISLKRMHFEKGKRREGKQGRGPTACRMHSLSLSSFSSSLSSVLELELDEDEEEDDDGDSLLKSSSESESSSSSSLTGGTLRETRGVVSEGATRIS